MKILKAYILSPGPDLRHLDGVNWLLLAPFQVSVSAEIEGKSRFMFHVTAPVGMRTDLASIPPAAWPIVGHPATFAKGAVIHDTLYRKPLTDQGMTLTREECDDIFHVVNDAAGLPDFRTHLADAGLEVGGWATWDEYRAKEGNIAF